MFEHFGVLDIFAGIRKYRWILSSIVAFFSVVFISLFIRNINNISRPDDNLYISSATYYIEPNQFSMGDNSSLHFPDNYIAMLNSDMFKKYLFDNLTSKYSSEFITKKSELKSSEFSFNENSVSELYYVRRLQGSMVIELSSVTYDKELSDSVRNCGQNFISNVAGKYITSASANVSGKLDKTIKKSEIKLENFDKDDPRLIVKPESESKTSFVRLLIKKVIFPILFIIILCILAIVLIGLFFPTINRLSDFSEYGIPVIGHIDYFSKIKENK